MLAALLVLAVGAVAAGGGAGAARQAPLGELVGTRLVVALRGTTPSTSLLERVRRGEVGGVILFGGNVDSPPQLRELTSRLQAAAAAGGQPPLLVTTDQEGGAIRRLAWAPPAASAAELGSLSIAAVRRRGAATARALRAAGVNVDLAPVADVPAVAGSFVAAQERAFSSDPERAARLVVAFAAGLADGGVEAAVKHFPGLGRADRTTDRARVRIAASAAELERGLVPFRRAIAAGVPLVMLSNASYTAWGPAPAAWSPRIAGGLLRDELGFAGVTITDALEAAAATHGISVAAAAGRSARAGGDLLLLTGSEVSSRAVHASLLAAARAGTLSRASLEESAARILALRRRLG